MSRRIAQRALTGLALCLTLAAGTAQAGIPGWEIDEPQAAPAGPTQEQINAEHQKRAAQLEQNKVQAELTAAWAETRDVSTLGPETIKLGDQATLALPDHYIYVPSPQANRILRAYGASPDANVVGLVVSTGLNQHWIAAIRGRSDGHVDDAPAAQWNAPSELARLKLHHEGVNVVLAREGKEPRVVTGWMQAPAYNAADHSLRWSLNLRGKYEVEGGGNAVVYHAAKLGRTGFYSIALRTTMNQIGVDRQAAESLIDQIAFRPGKAYGDFVPGTDPVAEYNISTVAEFAPVHDSALANLPANDSSRTWWIAAALVSLAGAAATLIVRQRRIREREAVDA